MQYVTSSIPLTNEQVRNHPVKLLNDQVLTLLEPNIYIIHENGYIRAHEDLDLTEFYDKTARITSFYAKLEFKAKAYKLLQLVFEYDRNNNPCVVEKDNEYLQRDLKTYGNLNSAVILPTYEADRYEGESLEVTLND